MDFKDYYAILGVPENAVAADIKKAYRKLARKYHPDVSKEKNAEARMKDINEANAVLSDPEKRAAYDQLRAGYRPGEEFRPPPDWDAGFEFSGWGPAGTDDAEFSDFFEKLFAHIGMRGRPRHAASVPKGEDHHAKIFVDLADAFRGARRQISLRVPGVDAAGHPTVTHRELNLRIPRGVGEAQLMRLKGQGGQRIGRGAPGDLLLEVHFNPDPRFRVQDHDLYLTLPVAPWEAALGAVVEIDLPGNERVKVRIPVGAQSGRQLRVRGKGIPSNPPGDLLLDVQIVVPPASTPRARELYESMARELAFDPRARR